MSWTDATVFCKSTKTNQIVTLASIPDSTTNDFLKTLTTQQAWIGGYRKSDKTWGAWTDGSTWGYTNWGSGQPNNYGGNQDYVVINFNDHGKWGDEDGEDVSGALCQYKTGMNLLTIIKGQNYLRP